MLFKYLNALKGVQLFKMKKPYVYKLDTQTINYNYYKALNKFVLCVCFLSMCIVHITFLYSNLKFKLL